MWSELRILLVGDERVVALNWEEWNEFPEQDLYHLPNCDLNSLCSLVEKHLHKEYDVIFLLGFHYDFICPESGDISETDSNTSPTIELKADINISEMIKTVQKFHYKWVKQYPNTNIIWTIPSPPDFLKYNSNVLKERGIDPEKRLNKKKQHTLSKDYFDLSRKLAKEWKEKIKYIPMFPLNKVLFMKKQCYKRSFVSGSQPKFPRGFLRDGMYPTKMMAIYCAYLLVEHLIYEGFYPENKTGLNLAEAEAKLIELEPDVKNYIYSSDRHKRKRLKYSRYHSYKHKRDSISPGSSSNESRPMSRSGRARYPRRSRSRPRYRSNSRSRERYRMRSRSGDRYRIRSRSRSGERFRMRSRSKERYKIVPKSKDNYKTRSRSFSRSLSRERYGKDSSKARVGSYSKSKCHSQHHRSRTRSTSSLSHTSLESQKTDSIDSLPLKTE